MSLEAITKIRSVEEDMDQAKADARARAQKLAAVREGDAPVLVCLLAEPGAQENWCVPAG